MEDNWRNSIVKRSIHWSNQSMFVTSQVTYQMPFRQWLSPTCSNASRI